MEDTGQMDDTTLNVYQTTNLNKLKQGANKIRKHTAKISYLRRITRA